MAAINLTPGHKYTLCTGNTVYAATPGEEALGDHEDQCALETQARLPLPHTCFYEVNQ